MNTFPIVELVVKIASRCNFNCTYCYEYNMGDSTWKTAAKFMSLETAELLSSRIQEHITANRLSAFSIGLHGGEPLLMSPEKLDKLVAVLKSKIDRDVNLSVGIQTNASLMTREHIAVFKKHQIHVSVSLDGVESVHDKNRLHLNGHSTWRSVIAGIELLRIEAPELFVGLLAVLDVESDPLENFDFLSRFGVDIDFLLPLRNHDNPPYYPENSPAAYGEWYFKIYEKWVDGRNSHVNVRFLKNIITQLLGGAAIYEVMTLAPVGILTISTDGFMEGVDSMKSAGKSLQVTNMHISKFPLGEVLNHEMVKMRQAGTEYLHATCRNCKYLHVCAGGYFPDRYSSSSGFDNPSVYCNDLFWLISKMEHDIKTRLMHEPVAV